ncbi:selenide, water dikinase SelD [soil metagenome]|jgi:selenide,water dikinase
MHDPNIIVGLQTSDDAAVYKISEEMAIVQTVDFFPPVVDDPFTYGAIAAANSMSDVFAMGGEVLFALNIAAFPDNLPLDILSRIFAGGADKAREVGIVIAGGHTITDAEPKYGLVVTGAIHPKRILTKAGARPGDKLYLTKPLGTGVITTAMKQEAADQSDADTAVESMLLLNRTASRVAQAVSVHACTDVTGFGLLGHATEMALKSGVALEINASAIPWLPGANRYASEGRLPGGAGRNREFYSNEPDCGVTIAATVDEVTINLLFNPETSGGLLIAVEAKKAANLEAAFEQADHGLWPIGEVQVGRGIRIV